MKFILIPDSFKGTLSSSQICAVMDEKIKKHFPDSLTVSIPVADGEDPWMPLSPQWAVLRSMSRLRIPILRTWNLISD